MPDKNDKPARCPLDTTCSQCGVSSICRPAIKPVTEQDLTDLHDHMRALEEVVAELRRDLDRHVEDEAEAHRGLVPGVRQAEESAGATTTEFNELLEDNPVPWREDMLSEDYAEIVNANGRLILRCLPHNLASSIVAAVNEKAAVSELEVACELLVAQYNAMPDGPLGHGLTNEPFLRIRNILEDRPTDPQGGKEK